MAYKTVNPYTNETVKEYEGATSQELEDTLQRGHELYQTFKKQDIKERADILHNVAAKIRERSDELARTCTIDMGKLFIEAKGEVELCAVIVDYFSDHAE